MFKSLTKDKELKNIDVRALIIEVRSALHAYIQPSWAEHSPDLVEVDAQSAQESASPSQQTPEAPSLMAAPFTQSQNVVRSFFIIYLGS